MWLNSSGYPSLLYLLFSSTILLKHNAILSDLAQIHDSTIKVPLNPLLASYLHRSASPNIIMSQYNIPCSNTVPYINNQNVLPQPINPRSANAKRMRQAERDRKDIYSIVPQCSPPPEFLSNDAFRILPKGWWKCTYAGCPVGAHDLGERLCPVFASKGKYLPDGRKEAERDPIDLQEANNVERWIAQLPALPTKEEIDVIEGGLEPGLEYAYEVQEPTTSKPQKLLSLRLPRRLGGWKVSLRDKPSGSK
ncbi:hypothetical protein BPAE_0014g00860 [Botrytis paeoniae]|uniref:Uncharacterized protein n=1 Tax=Botrytis paeoniae TaxID=278948 RepID=A0A4Z1FXH7_9HELO|nr:hypothetical protein BPAE_0014g00860 [Botrytis paeoniae]